MRSPFMRKILANLETHADIMNSHVEFLSVMPHGKKHYYPL